MTHLADLASSLPALNPEVSADVTDSLVGAVTGSADADGQHDRFGRETTLIAELDAFHPRDLEETVLVAQLLAAHHGAMQCLRAAGQCEVTGKEASRLRRNAIALQRSLLTTLRTLHKSQARPVSEDDLVPRPAVPVTLPQPAAAPRDHTPKATARPRPDRATPGARPAAAGIASDAMAQGAAGRDNAAADADQPAPKPQQRNPFEGHPDLQRLSDRWYDLSPWEEMTMEERRETFGYKYQPKDAAGPAAEDKAVDDPATDDQAPS